MARQRLGEKKLRRMRELTGLDLVAVVVRGGTDHRRDLWLRNGTIVYLWRDGTMTETTDRHSFDPLHDEPHP